MKKRLLPLAVTLIFCTTNVFAQKDTLTPEQTRSLLMQLVKDPKEFLSRAGEKACHCIDSISVLDKEKKEVTKEIGECIDKEVIIYETMIKINESFNDPTKEIIINADKNSQSYQNHYFDIERWLRDSCKALSIKMTSNEKLSQFSHTDNAAAGDEYNKGIEFIKSEDYKGGLPYFKKATELDENFAFAWDNLGICYRRTNQLDKAIIAYKRSLAIDPKGVTPLHNLPIAYEMKEEYDKALEAYRDISVVYPDDPEAFYGSGRIYLFFKKDHEKALDNMCKAYNSYVKLNSPYRVDAENNIAVIYKEMKGLGKEDVFNKILKENKISTN